MWLLWGRSAPFAAVRQASLCALRDRHGISIDNGMRSDHDLTRLHTAIKLSGQRTLRRLWLTLATVITAWTLVIALL